MRGQGLGKKLLEYTIDEARKYEKKYLRLYTSNAPDEVVAQIIYKKYGFKKIKQKKRVFYTKIIRELELCSMEGNDETRCQDEKADEAGQIKNLNTTMQLLLQQYQDYVGRKDRLENKALGHLTPLSILLAASVAILIMITQIGDKNCLLLLFPVFFVGQVVFTVLTFIYALKAYSVKTSWYPDIKEHSHDWEKKEACYLGRVNNAFIEAIEELDKLLKKLIEDVKKCRNFLIFSMFFGIFNVVSFTIYVFQYFLRG
jgi:hypothetical protein